MSLCVCVCVCVDIDFALCYREPRVCAGIDCALNHRCLCVGGVCAGIDCTLSHSQLCVSVCVCVRTGMG